MTLRKAYDEIMEKIKVTPEMRQRILERVAQENITSSFSKIVRFSALKKYLSLAACFTFLLVGVVALPRLLKPAEPEPPSLGVSNIVEAVSLEELSKLVGFEVTVDFSLPFKIEKTAYSSYWNEMAQIEYNGGEYSVIYRQSQGTDDNSGDYNIYNDITEITIDSRNITLKGDDNIYVLAVWTNGTYSYSMSISPGVSKDDWYTILK